MIIGLYLRYGIPSSRWIGKKAYDKPKGRKSWEKRDIYQGI
jgi:hypothetical protein